MFWKRIAAITILSAALVACGTKNQKNSANRQEEPASLRLPDFSTISASDVLVYECGDSLQFSAHVSSDSTWLFLPDTAVKTNPVTAGSGAKYQGAGYQYWRKGNKALLQQPGEALKNCETTPRRRTWEAARIRGVDFRAAGQEPGWYLEITDGKQIKYIGNYGKDTLITSIHQSVNVHPPTTYEVPADEHDFVIDIREQPCTAMNGLRFPLTVILNTNGQFYRGCGKVLE